jgi:hypothetical protein
MVFLKRVGEDWNVIEIYRDNDFGDQVLEYLIWKVAGLLVRPKYMTRGSNRPLLVQNAAFHSSSWQMRTLLYPQQTSSLVK